MILSREQILQADDVKVERVSVPEWGGDLFIRTMSGTERVRFEDEIISGDGDTRSVDKQLFFSYLLARTLIDEEGNPMFSTSEDIQQLMGKSGAVLMRLGNIATRLNGLSGQEQEIVKKNSSPALNGVSSSDLPSPSAVPSENS